MLQHFKKWAVRFILAIGLVAIGITIGLIMLAQEVASETGLDQAVIPLLRAAYYLNGMYVEPMDPQKTTPKLLAGLINNLDPHTVYLPPEDMKKFNEEMQGAYGGIGIGAKPAKDNKSLSIKDIQDKGPAASAGLKKGDKIMAIDGEPVEKHTLAENFKRIRGTIGTEVAIDVIDEDGKTKKINVKRAAIELPVAQWTLVDGPNGKIFWLRESQFNEELVAQTLAAIAEADKEASGKIAGIILDLRDNPGGLIHAAVGLSAMFGEHGATVVTARDRSEETTKKWSAINDDWNASEDPNDSISSAKDTYPWLDKAPMAVIVNRRSASASEIVAGALKDWKRATIVGNTTFGKGSIQTILPLGKNLGSMKITTSRYYTPAGNAIQAVGVQPDVEVKSALDIGIREADLPKHLASQNKPEQKGTSDSSVADKLDSKDPKIEAELSIEDQRSTFTSKLKPSPSDAYLSAAILSLKPQKK